MNKIFFKKEYLLLILIILLSALLRLPGIFSNSFAFTYDVGRDMLALSNIAYNHKLVLIGATTGIPGVFYGPWWYYLLTPFFILFQGNPQGIALLMGLIGIATVILMFYFGKMIGGYNLGLFSSFITAISPQMISLSSQIWNPNIAPLFVLLTFCLLYRIFSSKDNKAYLFIFVGILLGLNIDIEILWGIFFSIAILISMIIVEKKKNSFKNFSFMFLGLSIILLPRLIFELRHNFIMTKSFLFFVFSKSASEKLDLYHFLQNRYDVHLDQFSASFIQGDKIYGLFFIFLIFVSILFFFKKAPYHLKKIITVILTILIFFYIGTLIFKNPIWSHYLVGLPIIYILFFSIASYIIFKKNILFFIIFSAIIVLFNIQAFNFINLKQPTWEGNASVYRNQIAVIDYVYKEAGGKPFKYVAYTPPIFDYTYQYLFKWYGYGKYKYLPNNQARKAFFIIEPDPGYEDRIKWWLEDRVNDGKIINSKVLKGGIIVQTRIH